jgi:alkylation response protein AidB-like acyl-CoA dehydrogenase
MIGRIGIAAQMLGLAQGAFDKAVPYTYERKQFGQPVGTFQGMAFQIAQAAIELESARLLTYNAARRKEEGRSFTKEAAMAKYWASVVAQRVSGQAIEWAGGVGFTRETGIEKYWRDSKIVSISIASRVIFVLSLSDRLHTASGRYLRRDVQHSTTDHRQIHSEGILIESLSEVTNGLYRSTI